MAPRTPLKTHIALHVTAQKGRTLYFTVRLRCRQLQLAKIYKSIRLTPELTLKLHRKDHTVAHDNKQNMRVRLAQNISAVFVFSSNVVASKKYKFQT